MAMNKWVPESSPRILRRIGKTAEEASELTKVCARIIIQGHAGIDPATYKCNLHMLAEELADVQAQINCCVESLGLDKEFMATRTQRKQEQMEEWEALFTDRASNTGQKGN